MLPSGGSIPFVSTLAAATGIDVALLGFGLPDDAIHAPNERLFLPNLFRGTDLCLQLYQHSGQRPGSRSRHPREALSPQPTVTLSRHPRERQATVNWSPHPHGSGPQQTARPSPVRSEQEGDHPNSGQDKTPVICRHRRIPLGRLATLSGRRGVVGRKENSAATVNSISRSLWQNAVWLGSCA
jgi:hypothetical protein